VQKPKRRSAEPRKKDQHKGVPANAAL